MTNPGFIVIVLILASAIVSYKGFRDIGFFDRYTFNVDGILVRKEYYRLFTSGFLHNGWTHLILNMLTLYLFSGIINDTLGSMSYLLIYFASLLGGNLLALLIHRNHGDYTAVGASGAVCGVIFATVALYPGMPIMFFFIPIPFPNWLFAIAYVLYTIYGIKFKNDNIGHEAHLGGALVGMLVALLIVPEAFVDHYLIVLMIVAPSVLFIYVFTYKPHLLYLRHDSKNFYSVDHKYNADQARRQKEIDRILDKVRRKGLQSLTERDKATLKENSKRIK